MKKAEFIQIARITENQFYGIDSIEGNLILSFKGITSLPDGFNPTVGGGLYLYNNQLTALPYGFNPTVGGDLSLSNNQLTALPDGFNPTVGGGLYLSNNKLTALPKGIGNADLPIITWGDKYIKCDDRFSEVVSKKGNVWKLKDVNKTETYYLVTDGNGKFAHGKTIKEAKADLIYKLSSRDTKRYKGIDVNEKRSFSECVEMYRSITGSCSEGVKQFINSKGIKQIAFSVKEITEITKGAYGHETFKNFFK